MGNRWWTADIRHVTEEMLQKKEELTTRRKYIVILAFVFLAFWVLYDLLLVGSKEFPIAHEYSFEDKTIREIAGSMTEQSLRMVSDGDEQEQIIGFAHLIERNRYLLYQNEISLESYYDFVNNILYPKQKNSLKDKTRYAYQLNKYLIRMRKTHYEYLKYEMSEPEFYYEDFTRNARVLLVRTSLEGNREYHTHHFRNYKGRYYLYLK
jgi:hypothetical protein